MVYSKIKSFFSNQFAMTFIILICLFLIIIIKQFSLNNDLKHLNNLSGSINEINKNSIDKSQLSSANFSKALVKNSTELKKLESSLSDLKVSDKYTKHKTILLESIKKNQELFNSLNDMLINPSNENLSIKNKEAIKQKNELLSLYKQCNELKIKVNFEDTDKNLSIASLNYINEILKINRDQDIIDNQNATFKTQIDNIYNKFAPLNEDLFKIIALLEGENRNKAPLLDDVNKKIESFKEVKTELYDLSIPMELLDPFNSLKTVFDKYELYINSMREYILHDLNSDSSKEYLNKAKDNYEALNKSIEEFQISINSKE